MDQDKLNQLKEKAQRRSSFPSRDRYFMVEVDGSVGTDQYGMPKSFAQRPAAERHAKREGFGVYDRRDLKLVVEPDAERRLAMLDMALEGLKDRLRRTQAKRATVIVEVDAQREVEVV